MIVPLMAWLQRDPGLRTHVETGDVEGGGMEGTGATSGETETAGRTRARSRSERGEGAVRADSARRGTGERRADDLRTHQHEAREGWGGLVEEEALSKKH